jgi:hypothetical protein
VPPRWSDLADAELLAHLTTDGDQLPRAAIDEVLGRGERTIPALRLLLNDREVAASRDGRRWAFVHAALLLASLHPPGIFDDLLNAVRRAAATPLLSHFSEVDTAAPWLLAAAGPTALEPLRAILLDVAESRWMRAHAANALEVLVQRHEDQRPAIVAAFRKLVARNDESTPLGAWYLERLGEPSNKPATSGPIIPADHDLLSFYSEMMMQVRASSPPEAAPVPTRDGPKVGRNDPCPCGSGKKLKSCCGA